MSECSECGSSVEGELTKKPPIIRPAAWSEHAIEYGKILRPCQREHVVARRAPKRCALVSARRTQPFTQTTCRSVWTTSTRSLWAVITASISL
jgi:hypothetical protein